MPPRYVYWTILIDQQATAFRATSREDLLPTLHQLRRTNSDVVMKWFARGRLWESPEAERAARRKPKIAEPRGPGWRPGGQHKDPRARFDKRKRQDRRPSRAVAQVFRPADSERRPANSERPSGSPHAQPGGRGPARPKPFNQKPRRSGFPRPRRDRRK